jgi:hypothetical protein
MKFRRFVTACQHTGCTNKTQRILRDETTHTSITLCENHLKDIMDYLGRNTNMRELEGAK